MGKYLYVTWTPSGHSASGTGTLAAGQAAAEPVVTAGLADGSIVVEDVEADYQEVVRFHAAPFRDAVRQYWAWADMVLQRDESIEIYESDALREEIRALANHPDV